MVPRLGGVLAAGGQERALLIHSGEYQDEYIGRCPCLYFTELTLGTVIGKIPIIGDTDGDKADVRLHLVYFEECLVF